MNKKPEESLVLTIDFGTQSVRVSIFDRKGDCLAMEKEVYDPPYFSSEPNYAEQDPNLYYDCLRRCCKRLVDAHYELLEKVKGVTLTCFRDSAVLLDKDEKVIRPMILWLDQRMAECKKKLPFVSRLLFRLVGMSDTVEFNRRRCVANWIKENEPENYAKIHRYISISTYFIHKLTGNYKDSASNYAGHYPIDFKKRKFYKNPTKHLKGQIFSIRREWLPELVKEGELLGYISKEGHEDTGLPEGIPFYASGSDKSCETLGLGIIDDSGVAISYGTASTVETTTKKYVPSEPFLPGYASCLPDYYNMDIQIYRGYWMINWFLKEFGAQPIEDMIISEGNADDFNKKLNSVPPGSDGLVLQPYWGPGLSRPLAKGAIIGFSDVITQEHLYRAIIEGIAYALREGMESFEGKLNNDGFKYIKVSGGGSRSPEICQITADVFGLPVTRVQTPESSSLGAAIACFLAIGEFPSVEEAVSSMVHDKETFRPNPENTEIYDYLFYKVYVPLYPRLRKSYQAIKKFNKEHSRKLDRKPNRK